MTDNMKMMMPFTILMAAILIVPPVVVKLSKRANERAKEYERVTFMVTYKLRNKKREDFMAALEEIGMAEKSRQEKGCIMYEYYPSAEDENKLLLIEKWEKPADQRVHTQSPHFKKLAEIKNDYVLDTIIDKYCDR
jgi:quinol monooxygenase YgiN